MIAAPEPLVEPAVSDEEEFCHIVIDYGPARWACEGVRASDQAVCGAPVNGAFCKWHDTLGICPDCHLRDCADCYALLRGEL